MDNDDEGATANRSFFPRLLLLALALSACTEIEKEKLLIPTHASSPPEAKTDPPATPRKKKKKLYLTFDDGPNKGTRKVLNIVKQEEVPVTFFIIGEHVFASAGQKATWDSLRVTESIERCNHSHTHAWHNRFNSFYENPGEVVDDFEKCHDTLGLTNTIARTPGRNIWRVDTLSYTDLRKSAVAADSLQKAGFTIIGWDLEWHYDHKTFSLSNSAEDLLRSIDSVFARNRTRNPDHLVLLAHDQAYEDADDSAALHELIRLLKKREDFELALMTEYPGTKNNFRK